MDTRIAQIESQTEFTHLFHCPFTGLGRYNGFRGNKWLSNRLILFKQYVIPSLINQTSHDFILWISWRPEEIENPLVKELIDFTNKIPYFKTVHTFHGICFYDDKYEDAVARKRLFNSVKNSAIDLLPYLTGKNIYMTIQPSDDLYWSGAAEEIHKVLSDITIQAFGYSRGYIANYKTLEIAEYNPETNPPFYTISFPKEIFMDADKHLAYTSLKKQVNQYPEGTPLPSHEYVKDCLNYVRSDRRGFLVGTHGENISTNFNIPYKGAMITDSQVAKDFSLSKRVRLSTSLLRKIIIRLPFKAQRKIRYIFSEKLNIRI